MQDKNKEIAYESEKIDDKGLRASQRAILKLAEQSVENGEYDTGVDLYSKLLSNDKIPRTTKIKLEKNIKTIMTRIQKTVKVAQDMIPENVDLDKIKTVSPEKTSGKGSGGDAAGGEGAGQGGSGGSGTGSGTGADKGSGQANGSDSEEIANAAIDEFIDEAIVEGGDAETVSQVEEEIIYEVEPTVTETVSDGNRMFPSVNLKDVDMEGVHLKDVDLDGLQKLNTQEIASEKLVGENLFSDAIDYTIDKISENLERIIEEKVSSRLPEIEEKSLKEKIDEHKEEKLKKQQEELESFKEDNTEDSLTEADSQSEGSIEVDDSNVSMSDVDISIADGTHIDASGEHLITGDTTVQKDFPLNGPIPDKQTTEKILSGDEASDFDSKIDEDPSLSEQFFTKMDSLTHEMSDLNSNIEEIKPVFIQNISDGHFPKDESQSKQSKKAESIKDIVPQNDIQEAIQEEAIDDKGFIDTVDSLAKEKVQDIPFEDLTDILIKQAESLNTLADSVKENQESSTDTLDTIKDALLQQIDNQSDFNKLFEQQFASDISDEDISKAKNALLQNENTTEATEVLSQIDEKDISLDDDFFKTIDNLQSDLSNVMDDVSQLKSGSIEDITDSLFNKSKEQDEISKAKDALMGSGSGKDSSAGDFLSHIDNEEITLSDDFFNAVESLQSDMSHVKDDIDQLKSSSIGELSEALFPKSSDTNNQAQVNENTSDLLSNLPDLNQLQDVLSKAVEMTKNPAVDIDMEAGHETDQSETSDLENQLEDISRNITNEMYHPIEEIPEEESDNLSPDDEVSISDIQDKIDFITSTSNQENPEKDQFQKNIELAGNFFDKVNEFADRLQHGSVEHSVDQALAYLDEDGSFEEKAVAEKHFDNNMKETLSDVSEKVDAAVMDHQMSELVDKELSGELNQDSLLEFASSIKDATEGLNEAAQGIKGAAEDIRDANVITEEQRLEELTKRSDSLEKEVDVFKNLVEMLEKEQTKREESENTLKDFESMIDDLKSELDKKQDAHPQGMSSGAEGQPGYYPPQDGYNQEDEELDVFRAKEELLNAEPEHEYSDEEYNKLQFYPDIENNEDDYEDYDDDFKTLDDVMNEDLSHAREYTKKDADRDQALEEFHQDIDPAFIPMPYSTDYDYKNEDGFFQDVSGAPVVVAQPVMISDEALRQAYDENAHKQAAANANQGNTPVMAQAQAGMQAPAPSMMMPSMMPQQPYEKPKKPKRSLKEPIQLTYDFTNLFQNRYYRKYRDMLNEAATLVAEKKLDEALEFYYVIQDQNIPHSFKIMIQQNIRDIEETIADTFRFSDTIVKVGEAGDVSRVKVLESRGGEPSDMRITSNEISFHDS